MKICSINWNKLSLQLNEPYTIAYETVKETTNIILCLETDDGIKGWGCAAPDLPVTGETPEAVIEAVENIVAPVLKDNSPFSYAKINQLIKKQIPAMPSTRAMVDMALYDLIARKAEAPLYRLLGGFRHSIPTSITIGICPIDETLQYAKKFINDGFFVLKIKGGKNIDEDIEKVIKVRRLVGDYVKLRFDGNQGYTPEEAIRFINHVKEANLELFEQPTKKQLDEHLGKVSRNVDVPVMADESLKTLKDVFRLASNENTDMVNIKLMKVGGISEARQINAVANAAGIESMIGCLDECALGISAGLHFALSHPNIEYADLDGHLDLINDPFDGIITIRKGIMYPGKGNGLGEISQLIL